MKTLFTLWLLAIFTMNLSYAAIEAGELEERFNVIRSDILKWIKDGGANSLNFPGNISLDEYTEGMLKVLVRNEVNLGFVENDNSEDEELRVSVNGVPKTCRGFISSKDSRLHILCNIKRFKNTSESGQYKLVHHEYAGLAELENNEGAASDYFISSQLTDYLTEQKILKLALRPVIFRDASGNEKRSCFNFKNRNPHNLEIVSEQADCFVYADDRDVIVENFMTLLQIFQPMKKIEGNTRFAVIRLKFGLVSIDEGALNEYLRFTLDVITKSQGCTAVSTDPKWASKVLFPHGAFIDYFDIRSVYEITDTLVNTIRCNK